MITYRATLDVSRELAQYIGWLLRAERSNRGTRKNTRKLTPFWHAVLVLRWFRDRTDVAALARDARISPATAYRYLDEGITVLADQAPDLHEVLERALAAGTPYLILDGKIFETDRTSIPTTSVKGKIIDLWYSGKAHRHGGNIQALTLPNGLPVWVSETEPGSVHDLTAAREHVFPALYAAAAKGLRTLADLGYEGAGHGVLAPIKQPADGKELHHDNKTYNALLRSLRAQGERGFSLLTQRWRALQHITLSPSKITNIVKAALVLVHFEHGRSH